jgi:hypothetical protein
MFATTIITPLFTIAGASLSLAGERAPLLLSLSLPTGCRA